MMKKIVIVLCLLAMVVMPLVGKGATEAGTDPSKPYAGTTLRVLDTPHPLIDGLKAFVPEFTEKTGIKVEFEDLATDQKSQKLLVELMAGSSTIDITTLRPLNELKLFGLNKFAEDLNPYLANDTEYDLGDFLDAAIESCTFEGQLLGVPLYNERAILYYRKDLFQQKGIEPPKTLEQLEQYAKMFNDPKNNFFGIVARGRVNQLITGGFASYLFSFGGDFNTLDKALMDSPEAIKAMKFYANLLRSYGPPGIENYNWPEAAALMAQGHVAMFTDADAIYLNVADPAKSPFADKIGYAVFPAGPAGAKPFNVVVEAMMLNPNSKQKEAAVEFIKWATSKDVTLRIQQRGLSMSRASVWDDPSSTKSWPEDLVKVMVESNKIAKGYDRPRVINVAEARDILSRPILIGFEGGDIEAAAKIANAEFQALIDEENK
ncbi:MAG: sugar ABC transporter substrate-binding protein [Sphaerochaetaceae bacterium]|mgnify:CR=1 FL=1|jgi:multiple sugar transport system substrate-binding protein|nr:sugar ABC transporter substrate-binding protein [Sphaerochaetaceae bacterium]